jgi:carbon storage regulator
MLVLCRKPQESVVVGDAGGHERLLTVTVLGIRGNNVRLGFNVAPEIPVHRQEVWDRIQAEVSESHLTPIPPASTSH